MLTAEEKQKLIDAGYTQSYDNVYYFKTITVWVQRTYIYTTAFINKFNKVASFEGANEFKQELKSEANSLIGGLQWQN